MWMSPARATLLHSPGRKPWVNSQSTYIEPQKGAALLCPRQMLAPKVPLLRSSDLFYLYVPRVSYRALPSFYPGLCRGVVPTALIMRLNFDAVALALGGVQWKFIYLYCISYHMYALYRFDQRNRE